MWDDIIDYGLMGFVWLLVAVCVGMILFIPYALYKSYQWNKTHTCVESHIERRAAWVQYIPTGKTTIPVFHPERDETVCDKWEEKRPGLIAP